MDIDWTDRDLRRRFVIHAEANALRYARPGEVAVMAATMMPCVTCVLSAASYSVPLIVYDEELDPKYYDIPFTMELAADCGIEMRRWK